MLFQEYHYMISQYLFHRAPTLAHLFEQLHLIGEYSPPTMANIAEKSPLATANNNSLDPAAATVAEPVRLEKKLSPQQIQAIDHLLKTADMVKFAKAQPPLSFHVEALYSVKTFVEQTKEEDATVIS